MDADKKKEELNAEDAEKEAQRTLRKEEKCKKHVQWFEA